MAELTPKRSPLSDRALFWREFFILLGAGLLGVIAVLPYTITLQGGVPKELPIPFPLLLAIGVAQNGLILALAIGVGLLCARRVGLGAPILEGWLRGEKVGERGRAIILPSILLGLGAGLLIIILERAIFMPHLPSAFQGVEPPPPGQGFLASFYGGIAEEILLRLFLVSLLAWLISRVWNDKEGKPTAGGMWLVIVVASVLFGLGHLPATAQLTSLTPLIIVRAVVLNGLAGLAFGYLYWKQGLESAMLAHFSTDMLLHVIFFA
ncbi:MAG: type II CAAX prenyl endopeptidase Rce1 family protein [Anaerolineae bacterium]